jgi:hypothetical protein
MGAATSPGPAETSPSERAVHLAAVRIHSPSYTEDRDYLGHTLCHIWTGRAPRAGLAGPPEGPAAGQGHTHDPACPPSGVGDPTFTVAVDPGSGKAGC